MTYQNYEFTAFTEADFGVGNVACGDTFTMPGSATTCITVCDNDPYLAGDSYCNENSGDAYGQQATIEGDNGELGNGGQIYAESYFWVCDQDGNWYVMIEIEQEGSSQDYFTFYTGGGYSVPPEGAVLTVGNSCNVDSGNTWLDMKCLDAGEKEPEPGNICGRLTFDADCNNNEWNDETGQWDEGVAGQTVELLDLAGNVVATTTTDANGAYDFSVAPGQYQVKFPSLDGYKFSEQDSGVAEHYDSDADANGLTGVVTVYSGEITNNVDAGIKLDTGSISGTVFCDTDCDGINGEVKIVPGCDYTIEAEDMNMYGYQVVSGDQASGGQLAKLTGWDGDLTTTFGGKAGTYDLKLFVQDENDGQSEIYVKVNGELIKVVKLDRDSDGGGSNNGGFSEFVIEGVELDAGAEIMLWVGGDGCEWVRIDKIELEGHDTTEVVSEPTKAGVVIKLLDAAGNPVLDGDGNAITTVTDADGNYSFDNVPVGDYTIMGVAPDGTEFTVQDAGSDDSIDSDVDANGMSGVISVTSGGNADVDLGVCDKPLGSIAGTYFCDENDNSVQDTGEAVLANQTVWLLKAGSGVIASTTTDENGDYIFEGLEAGNYSVRFDGNNNGGKTFVDGNVGSDDTIDSDVVNVGGAGNGNTGTIVLGEGENKENVDAGVEIVPGSLSGKYFCDENNDDLDNDGDNGIAGVTVELLDAAGNGTGITTTTAADGSYSFGNLAPGTYGVKFTDTVSGKTLVDANVGSDDSIDSDATDAGNGMSTITGISVTSGNDTPDNDAGVETVPGSLSGKYFCDDNNNDIDDGGAEPGIGGVTVELLDAAGNGTGRTTTTAADGTYSFTGLVPGLYGVKFTDTVSGKTLVDANVGSDDSIDSDAIDAGNGMSTITGITVVAGQDTPDNDAGVENIPPAPQDDAAKTCADEEVTVDVLANDGDPSLVITAVDGQAITEGASVTTASGVVVTMTAGQLVFDGEAAYAALDIGQEAIDNISYTVSDGTDTTDANVAVTFCGDANDYASLSASFPATTNYVITGALNDPSAFTVAISGSGDARFDGATFSNAYCLSFFDPIPLNQTISGDVFGTEEAGAPGVFDGDQISLFNGQTAADNLDLVSWIVAQDFEGNGLYDGWDVQFAIWELTDNIDTDDWTGTFTEATVANVDAILALASAHEGFSFGGDGSVVGAIIDPNPQTPGVIEQPFIVGFAFDEHDCLC